MVIVKNTSDLLQIAAAQAVSDGCRRCIDRYPEDVVFYGQFGATPNTSRDMWIIAVYSPHGKEWILSIRAGEKPGSYSVCRIHDLSNVPWRDWRGSKHLGPKNLLVDGTYPERTEELKSQSVAYMNSLDSAGPKRPRTGPSRTAGLPKAVKESS